jgi:hypothetical protein
MAHPLGEMPKRSDEYEATPTNCTDCGQDSCQLPHYEITVTRSPEQVANDARISARIHRTAHAMAIQACDVVGLPVGSEKVDEVADILSGIFHRLHWGHSLDDSLRSGSEQPGEHDA